MSRYHLKPAEHKQFQFGPWLVSTCKWHILQSEGTQRQKFEQGLELPQVPEMVFAENYLTIEHQTKVGLKFCAFDALNLVDAHSDPIKVAASDEWQNARSGFEHIKNVVSPFDWTFTTHYKGSLLGTDAQSFQVETTSERIDLEKLKRREPIGFYDDILLFEDELSDNGTSILNVKVRVMPSCFFILMRQFIRVDQVLIRINDTRIYHEAGTDYILREFSSKEESTSKIPAAVHTDPNEVGDYLTTKIEQFDKLTFAAN